MIRRFAREAEFHRQKYACPNSFTSERIKIIPLIQDLKRTSPEIKKNIFRSVKRIRTGYLL